MLEIFSPKGCRFSLLLLHTLHDSAFVSLSDSLFPFSECYYKSTLSCFQKSYLPPSLVSRILVRGTDSIISDENADEYNAISGFMAGLANTLFFSFCPQLFKAVAFFEGASSSLEKAERKAVSLECCGMKTHVPCCLNLTLNSPPF